MSLIMHVVECVDARINELIFVIHIGQFVRNVLLLCQELLLE